MVTLEVVTDLASLMMEAGLTSPMLPENRSDPYPTYAFIRRHEPVHHAPDGTWVVTRYDHAASVLRDPRFSTNPARLRGGVDQLRSPVRQAGSNLMLFLDPPDHTRLRSLVSQAFTPRTVDSLKPRIERLVGELLDAVIERGDGELDVLADLAYPLPTVVICELLGVPVADRESFKVWAAGASRLLDNYVEQAVLMEGMAAGMELARYLTNLIEERRQQPGGDLLSALIAAEAEGDRLTQAELLSTVSLLLIAGFETTMNLIGNGMLALLRHPSEMDRLRADPGLVRSAVEEFIRYDGPVHVTARIALTDVELGGRMIREGEQLALSLGAANRDPEQFPDPDRLDVGRAPNRHLGFGGGPHFCLGAPLARSESQVAMAAVLRRFPHLELATENPTYRDHFVVRGLTDLKVAITPRPG